MIPYLDPSITLKELRRAVVDEYHFAILGEKLVVEFSDGSSIERIDANHIPPNVGDDELSARVALAQYAVTPNHNLGVLVSGLSRPLRPENLHATIYHCLGIDPKIHLLAAA